MLSDNFFYTINNFSKSLNVKQSSIKLNNTPFIWVGVKNYFHYKDESSALVCKFLTIYNN
ncbi:hypothetical protein PIROE2DRAFT_18829 [Piromyces sp. E2]|nr:hypothetical protein PIROE2DRAFT_18829 [Piromyces sp. E2]|eukprot:OUM56530.1 hypothetical protein PIROE2DRAFT_18829 [Piromyces sp. E2]